MKHNLKVAMTLEALDLELEILEKSQQQILMGGSDGSSNGGSNGDMPSGGVTMVDPTALLNQMFGVNGAPPGGATFVYSTSATVDSVSREMRKGDLYHSMQSFASTPAGYKLLQKIAAQGTHITLDDDPAHATTSGNGINAVFYSGTESIDVHALTADNLNIDNISAWAHELFHAYDYNSADCLNTDQSEYQAYLMQWEVQTELGYYNPTGTDNNQSLSGGTVLGGQWIRNSNQNTFQDNSNLLLSNGWDLASFNAGMTHFKSGSAANTNSYYTNNGTTDSIVISGDDPNARQKIADFLHLKHL